MSEHQIALPPNMPSSMRSNLRRDDAGRPVPFFVEWIDGKPDFRVMNHENMGRAITEKLCWVCGRRLTRGVGTFVAGPMCVINHVSAEPPSHAACAEWSARACPFLNNPNKERRERNLPAEAGNPAGIMIARNPGVSALIESNDWNIWRPSGVMGQPGLLWDFKIVGVRWMAYGREATGDEVLHSVETGIATLKEMADLEETGRAALAKAVSKALRWLPLLPATGIPQIEAALHP